jgi:ferredoxin--NADP+ reductase
MFRIIHKEDLATDITKFIIDAPVIAQKARAGQFVVAVIDAKGERIPLTIADWNKDKGTITLIFQKIGYTTKKLGMLKTGDSIQHMLGPLGRPTEINPSTTLRVDGERNRTIKKFGTVICIGGGVGIAEVYPVSRAFKEAGNSVIGIIGSRAKDLIILEKEMRQVCDELFITTDNGTYGEKGLVTDVLKKLLAVRNEPGAYNLVYAIGPVRMMKSVSELTKTYQIKTLVSLNPIMVDATGMCGSCRCKVGGKTVFGCVDGPDFDAHLVDFDELEKRLKLFINEEKKIYAE